MSSMLRLFHALPYSARCAAASARGLWLDRWRYGAETQALAEAALERDGWSAMQWQRHQERQLPGVLHRAATRVPYYRAFWAPHVAPSNLTPWDRMENWPILDKETVRRQPRAFLSEAIPPGELFEEHTSGSSGTPLTLWISRRALRHWFALVEARLRRWHGFDRSTPWAILGGQLVAPPDRKRPPFWVHNRAMRQLYLSSYHIDSDSAPHYLAAIQRHDARYLLGYPSALCSLAQAAKSRGADTPPLEAILSNAEPLLDHQREELEHIFGCPVFDTYGMAEIVSAGSECSHRVLHRWPEVGVTEVLDLEHDAPAPVGSTGRLVATGLLNEAMPLIRYAVGDLAESPGPADLCACGRHLPRLGPILGRQDDAVVTPSGRLVGRLDPVFKRELPITEAQIIQDSLEQIRVRIVPAEGFSAQHASSLERALHDRLGEAMKIEIETVSHIPRGSAGKFKAVVSHVTSPPPP